MTSICKYCGASRLNTSDSQLVLKSVAEIAAGNFKFFIPDYQRGYRWEQSQVKDLLEDLIEFFQSGKSLYCLQPLVVVRKGDEWEVVDGQQRLTTLFLILSNLSGELPGFEVRYQRHELPLGEIISDMDKRLNENCGNPDFHYISEANQQIRKFLDEDPERRAILEKVRGSSVSAVSFIWYHLPEEDSIAAFTRLNAGRIPLTDVELIRALFLRGDRELKESERLRIATAWDQMEKRLNEDEFWGFAAPVGFAPENRIELVFHMVAGMRLEVEDHQLFHYVESIIRSFGLRETWEKMESAFSALEEWYEDHTFFHLVGYLSNAKGIMEVAVWNLYPGYWLSGQVATKDSFRRTLKGIIRKDLLKDQKDHNVRSYIEGLKYAQSIKSPLLCFNLASLLNDEQGTVRFSFYEFRKVTWDVEHIHALATNEPTGADLDGFLEMYLSYFEDSKNSIELSKRLKSSLDGNSKADAVKKAELYRECRELESEEDLDEEIVNAIGNLTLLDSNTNRGFKNASYRVKRAWILDPKRQHIYVLPCTRSVFTKSYSAEAGELLRWNLQTGADGDSYALSMADQLEAFFHEAKFINPSQVRSNPTSNGRVVIPEYIHGQPQTTNVFLHGEALSFLELVETYGQIEIPLIQRDYAQGRKSQDTVRAAFLDSIFRALGQEGGSLNLDFVYGTGNKGENFYPIDGQQRLTTLFLLHWVAYSKSGKAGAFREIMLEDGVSRFRYGVRPGAERFFPALLKWERGFDLPAGKWFGEELSNQIWFSRNWLNDPTVLGSLVMLDEIKVKVEGLSSDNLDSLIERLGSIKMEVLVLPSAISADEIYLKMNARGKPLTGFEKFKAWLVGQHSLLDVGFDWKLRLDQEWLEFFWGRFAGKHPRAGAVSACYFNTVLALAINHQAGHGEGDTQEKFGQGLNDWIELGQSYRVDQWERLFDVGTIRSVFTSLDGFHIRAAEILELMDSGGWISKEKLVISDPDLSSDSDSERKLSYSDRCWLHAVTLFCKGIVGNDREWLRVARNLISNTDLRNIANFSQTIRSLDKLANDMGQGVLQGLELLVGNGFHPKSFGDQLDEERTKARMLNAPDEAWQGIRSIENHVLLRGNIGILLENPVEEGGSVDSDVFAVRKATFELLMDRGRMNSSIKVDAMTEERLDRLLIRAVLARCESIKEDGEVMLPWIDDGSWGKALKRDWKSMDFQHGLLRVIDEVIDSKSHISPQLLAEELIRISNSQPLSRKPWMLDLIRHGEVILAKSEKWKMKYYHNWRHDHERAYFVFQKVNRDELMDVLIGVEFDVRNALVTELMAAGWELHGACEMTSASRKIFSGHHPVLRRDGRTMTFHYQKIVLEENEQKWLIDFINGDGPLEVQDVLEVFKGHGVRVDPDRILPASGASDSI